MVRNPEQIIDANGGPAAFAHAVGAEAGAVRMWKLRNRIPRTAWPEVLEAFPDLTIDDLKAAEQVGGKPGDEAAA